MSQDDPFSPPVHSDPFATPRSTLKLRRVGVVSLGKLFGVMGLAMGLFVGGFVTLFALLGAAAQNGPGNPGPLIGMGAGAIVILPAFYGVGGFLGGVFYAVLYNILAGFTGGVELEFER